MRFPCLAALFLGAFPLTSCVAPRPTPGILSAQPIPGHALLVFVSPVRGFTAGIQIDDEKESRSQLIAGGSLQYQLKPGKHRLRIAVGTVHPVERDVDFSVAEGQAIFITLNPSGLGTSMPGPVALTLIEVSREKAARIAMF